MLRISRVNFRGFFPPSEWLPASLLPTKEIKKPIEKPTTYRTEPYLAVQYGECNGKPVELEYYPLTNEMRIRTPRPEDRPGGGIEEGDEELETLKTEVSKIFTQERRKVIPIGDSGFFLSYLGGYPQWSPSISYGGKPNFVYLFFSDKVVLTDNVFYITGDDNKASYYPYADSVGRESRPAL